MFGAGSEWLTVTLIQDYPGFLLAILPPGAFIGLALLVAFKQAIDQRSSRRARAAQAAQAARSPEPAAEAAG